MRLSHGLWRSALVFSFAFSLALAGHAEASAASPDLVNARLQGAWNLQVTVASYSGPKDPHNKPVGHAATDKIWFESACPSPGSCTVRIWGPGGPDPSQAAFFQYFGTASGFEGGPSGLLQNGATYSISIPVGGFGGLVCSPPRGSPRPSQRLTLRVTDAKPDGTGWLATTLTGTESLVAGWGCSGGQPTGWIVQNLSILGHPVGYIAPAAAGSSVLKVSSLATALNSPRQAFRSPVLALVDVAVTALVILFVTFPSALFNHTLSENYGEITAALNRFERLTGLVRRTGTSMSSALHHPPRELTVFATVLLIGSVINGLLDPRFGFNWTSAVSFFATVATLIFGVGMSALVGFAYRRARRHRTDWHFHALPLGLVVAAACVLLSRLTDFQPGYFYGLVCGIAFGTALARTEEGHTAAVGAVVTMALAVAAWFAWSAVSPDAGRPGAGWPVVLLDDFLASVFVGGLVGNVIALLPLKSLQGGKLIAWRRLVWGAIFAVAVFGLVQVLLHPEQGAVHASQAPLATAIILFLGFGGGSVAFNRYFAWKGRPTRLAAAAVTANAPEREPAVGA